MTEHEIFLKVVHLRKMLDRGLISREEYNNGKKELNNNLRALWRNECPEQSTNKK